MRLFLLLLLMPLALAQQGHVTLLTVADNGNASYGGTADLYVDIRPGTGQIFLDTYPLTRLDTQSSTRYANQVACDYLDVDCSAYDFFYTIRADSSVVGGPSAGAAIAVLTAVLLDGGSIDESIAITGTINSGGIIGPVAGIRQKAEAAADKGMDLLLISAFSFPTELNRSYVFPENESRNLSQLYVPINLTDLPLPVLQVTNLNDALAYFTGKQVTVPTPPQPPAEYEDIMADVAQRLCSQRESLRVSLNTTGLLDNYTEGNFSQLRDEALERGDTYSAASYCFGSLVDLRTIAFSDLDNSELRLRYAALSRQVREFKQSVQLWNLTTLAELETSMIVDERLEEARSSLIEVNLSNVSARRLAFVHERLNSATVWSAFRYMPSSSISLDPQHLTRACNDKVIEAEERINYAELYLPEESLLSAREELAAARVDLQSAEHANCIFRASKAQALADLLSGSLSVSRDHVDALVDGKLAAVERLLQDQTEKGYFPIIGYSYYRYSASLAQHDPYSALTFSEYALELSNLDRYFPRESSSRIESRQVYLVLLFSAGLVLGIAIGFVLALQFKKSNPERPRAQRTRPPGKKR